MMRGRIVDHVHPPQPKRPKPSAPARERKDEIEAKLKQVIKEQEQTFLHLVEERRSLVARIEDQSREIQSQLVEARKKLIEAENQLKSFRERASNGCYEASHDLLSCNVPTKVKAEPIDEHPNGNIPNPSQDDDARVPHTVSETNENKKHLGGNVENPSPNTIYDDDARVPNKISETNENKENVKKSSPDQPVPNIAPVHIKSERGSTSEVCSRNQFSGSNSKGNVDLVLQVASQMKPCPLNALHHHYFPSQHKRKLKSLIGNTSTNTEQTFATSALDGAVNVWQVQGTGERISLHKSVQCLSPEQKRWPQDIAWHPSGDVIFACYCADGKDDQVAIINALANEKVVFLKDKPHEKGIINNIVFLPWKDGTFFTTGGCDHGVVLWKEVETQWKAEVLHRTLHSSAVMGVGGMYGKSMILSAGADKRVIGFNTVHGREEFRYQLESKALGVLPNPVDHNLFMVQTGRPEKQLRLFDVRMQPTELHAFGWQQESTDSQSSLIDQNWSPDGLYIASGSADPKIHLFDIRYNSQEPSQSIRAHQRRVFKAVWHPALPLLMSISSDLTIGLIKLSG